jgi:hypothetical protein
LIAVVAQLVEHDIGNIEVIGSIPINGSLKLRLRATLAQLVEHGFRKAGVPSSILGGGSLSKKIEYTILIMESAFQKHNEQPKETPQNRILRTLRSLSRGLKTKLALGMIPFAVGVHAQSQDTAAVADKIFSHAPNYGMLTKPSANYPHINEIYVKEGGNYKFAFYQNEEGHQIDIEEYLRKQQELKELHDQAKVDYPARYVKILKEQLEYENDHIKEFAQKRISDLQKALADKEEAIKYLGEKDYLITERNTIKQQIENIQKDPSTLKEDIDEKKLFEDGQWFQKRAQEKLAEIELNTGVTKEFQKIQEKTDAEKKWLEDNVASKVYHDRLMQEGGTEEEYQIRLKQAQTIPVELNTDPHFAETGNSQYFPKENKVVVIAREEMTNPTEVHEGSHGILRGKEGITKYAGKLLTESFIGDSLTEEEKIEDIDIFAKDGKKHYWENASERYSRREVLIKDLENLGVWKYGQPFTQADYQKALELQKAGKLSRNGDQFIRMTKPEKFLDVMNTIAGISEEIAENRA